MAFHIESSVDLRTWATVYRGTIGTGGATDCIVPAAGGDSRFYRAATP
jgi:hypothetical protein